MNQEPAVITSLISAAIVATINVLALIFGWDVELVTALNLAAAAWVGVAGFIIRSRVTPIASGGDG